LPPARRERRPALAALALLLVLGGALASGLSVYRAGQRSDFLVLVRDVAPGQRLTEGDLGVARIAGTGARAVPAERRQSVVGQYLTVGGYAGMLMTPEMTVTTRPIPPDGAVVGVALDAGLVPAGGVSAGDVVRVLKVPGRGGDGLPVVRVVSVGSAAGTRGDSGVLGSGTVSSATVVNVLVPADSAGNVAAASAQRQGALVLLPASVKPVVGGP
jgi:hypothetical protein